ncbi:MAG: DUF4404 family protein [Gammaproteobacteria bacterium]|nr:DUF4404 family protein [Gammaproteobacteria bacterium]MCP4411932.1 DUF4404 family protein [Gammaproteobacteria bacterium]
MKKQELENILNQLKDELARSEFSKSSSRQDLQTLIQQIEQALIDDEAVVRKALNEPITDAVTRFEGSHPQLTSLLNSIISTFSNMGI